MPEKRTPLRLAQDYRHEYRGTNAYPGWCRVRVYETERGDDGADPSGRPVVVMSEPGQGTDSGPSVTNAVEIVAAEVVMRFALPSSRTVFVEHYERSLQELEAGIPETFDLVTFSRTEPDHRLLSGRWLLTFGEPSWRHSDRAGVEDLVGRSLND
jgi:hypothetical protein